MDMFLNSLFARGEIDDCRQRSVREPQCDRPECGSEEAVVRE